MSKRVRVSSGSRPLARANDSDTMRLCADHGRSAESYEQPCYYFELPVWGFEIYIYGIKLYGRHTICGMPMGVGVSFDFLDEP